MTQYELEITRNQRVLKAGLNYEELLRLKACLDEEVAQHEGRAHLDQQLAAADWEPA